MPLPDLFLTLIGLFTKWPGTSEVWPNAMSPFHGRTSSASSQEGQVHTPSQKPLTNGLPPSNLCPNHPGKNLSRELQLRSPVGQLLRGQPNGKCHSLLHEMRFVWSASCVSCAFELAELLPQKDRRHVPNLNCGVLIAASKMASPVHGLSCPVLKPPESNLLLDGEVSAG